MRLDRKASAILTLGGPRCFTLVLAAVKGAAGADVDYHDGLQLGFFVEHAEAVDGAYRGLAESGHEVGGPPRPIRGRYGFYFRALGGVLFEVSAEN